MQRRIHRSNRIKQDDNVGLYEHANMEDVDEDRLPADESGHGWTNKSVGALFICIESGLHVLFSTQHGGYDIGQSAVDLA